MLSYINQWGSLGPLMAKTVSTLHGDTRCVRTSSCFKCILNLEFWESRDFVSISSTIFINAKYNVTLLLQCGFLFLLCFFLPHPSGCFCFRVFSLCFYVHVLHSLNSLLMLSMVEFGALVGLLEVELPPGSGVYWNCSTECCQFYWIPPFPGGCCIGNQCCPEAKWCTSVFSIFLETGCWFMVVCWPHSMPSTCNR